MKQSREELDTQGERAQQRRPRDRAALRAEAERLHADPVNRAEIRAIMEFMDGLETDESFESARRTSSDL